MQIMLWGWLDMSKILLINDCRFESIIMEDMLLSFGYEIKRSTEESALDEYKNYMPDVTIVNLIMKNTTGDQLISKIKDIDDKVICLLSSCNRIKREDFDMRLVDGIIHTPIESNKLKETLDRHLNNKVAKEYLFCPFCGKKLQDGFKESNECPFCGHNL